MFEILHACDAENLFGFTDRRLGLPNLLQISVISCPAFQVLNCRGPDMTLLLFSCDRWVLFSCVSAF